MSRKLTLEEFIINARLVHGNKYDYSFVIYINARTDVKIICPEHGPFYQSPNNHVSNKTMCPHCANELNSYSNEEYIEKVSEVHNNKFDYSLTNYKNIRTKIIIICPKHGEFTQIANNHLNLKQGCDLCNKIDIDIFTENAEQIHGKRFDYSLSVIKTTKDKIKIICKNHGVFEQTYDGHIHNESGCPKCQDSHGERDISKFLEKNNINYNIQKKFDGCKNKRHLPFDFFLPEHNVCIEYDGEQHFKSIKYFGGDEKLKQTQKHDKIKNDFCTNNNIELLRIKYNESIEEKMTTFFDNIL